MPAATPTITMTMTTGTITAIAEGGLYRLLAWLSPAFPVGAYSYSHGLEAAVEAGAVRDRATLASYVATVVEHGAGRIDADLFRDAWLAVPLPYLPPLPPAGEGRGEGIDTRYEMPSPLPSPASGRGGIEELREINLRADIHRGTAETALEARAQGEAFLGTLRAAWPDPFLDEFAAALDRPPAYAVVVAIAAARAGVPLAAALEAYLQAVAANLVSAGVRLVPLGQTDGQRALAALEAPVRRAVAASLVRDAEDFGSAAFAVDLFSMAHETQYTRLFRS